MNNEKSITQNKNCTSTNEMNLDNNNEMASIVKWFCDLYKELCNLEDYDKSIDRILLVARKVTNAEAGTIFFVENNMLEFAYTQNDTLDATNELTNSSISFPINEKSIAGYCAHAKSSLNIPNVYEIPVHLPFTFNNSIDKLTKFKTVSILCLPLIGKQSSVIGVIQLINRIKNGSIVPFPQRQNDKITLLNILIANYVECYLLNKKLMQEKVCS